MSLWVLVMRTDSAGLQLDKTYTVRKTVTKGKRRRRKKVPGPLTVKPIKRALAPFFAAIAPPPSEEIAAVDGTDAG